MTPTERQRRWRQRLQAQTSEPDANVAAPPDSPAGKELSEQAADQARIETLTRERDEAVRQRDGAWAEHNHLRRERDEACEQRDYALKGVVPNPELVGDHI